MHKKTLVVVFSLAILLAGCGNDEYAVEKRYWQAQQEANKIFKNPHSSPPRELDRVAKILSAFSQKYPNTKLAVEADFNIARLYLIKEAYDKGRMQLRATINKYRANFAICAEALFLIGNSYQIEGKWNLALEQYKKIMQDYPKTIRGLNIPIYIAQYYKIKYQPDKMLTAYQEAIAYYRSLAEKYPNSALSYSVDILVAQCYVALKDWQNALSSFKTILEEYKGKVANLDAVLMNISVLYMNELKDKIKAREMLQRLIKEYPKSRLAKPAIALLKEMDKK